MKKVFPMLLFLLASLVVAADPVAKPSFELQNGASKAGWVVFPDQKKAPHLAIHSERGIGSMKLIRPVEGKWPEKLAIRLHLRGLEKLELSSTRASWQSSVSSTDARPLRIEIRRENAKDAEVIKDPASSFFAQIQGFGPDGKAESEIPLPKGGWFELIIPPGLLEHDPHELRVRWIDFYR